MHTGRIIAVLCYSIYFFDFRLLKPMNKAKTLSIYESEKEGFFFRFIFNFSFLEEGRSGRGGGKIIINLQQHNMKFLINNISC